MRESRTEIPGGIHRISRSASEGHAESHDQIGDRECSQATLRNRCAHDVRRVAGRAKGEDYEHQKAGCDELAEEIDTLVLDCRHGAECSEHSVRIAGGCLVMV